MYVIKELVYGLDLSNDETKPYIDNLQEQDFGFIEPELNGHAYFPYHGGVTSFDNTPFRFGIFIDDDDDGDLADSFMDAVKDEEFYQKQYKLFTLKVYERIEELREWTLDEPLGEYFDEEYKQNCLKSLSWLEKKVDNEDPTFYFTESSS